MSYNSTTKFSDNIYKEFKGYFILSILSISTQEFLFLFLFLWFFISLFLLLLLELPAFTIFDWLLQMKTYSRRVIWGEQARRALYHVHMVIESRNTDLWWKKYIISVSHITAVPVVSQNSRKSDKQVIIEKIREI